RSRAAGRQARVVVLQDVHRRDRDRFVEAVERDHGIADVPNAVLPKGSKAVSLAGKPVMVMGDAAFLANAFYMSGTPLPLAFIAGASAGMTAVAAGTIAGRQVMQAQQRHARGALPDRPHPSVTDLFRTDGHDAATAAGRFWSTVALVTSLMLGIAI